MKVKVYNNSTVTWITTVLVHSLQSKTVVQVMHAVSGEGMIRRYKKIKFFSRNLHIG